MGDVYTHFSIDIGESGYALTIEDTDGQMYNHYFSNDEELLDFIKEVIGLFT